VKIEGNLIDKTSGVDRNLAWAFRQIWLKSPIYINFLENKMLKLNSI